MLGLQCLSTDGAGCLPGSGGGSRRPGGSGDRGARGHQVPLPRRHLVGGGGRARAPKPRLCEHTKSVSWVYLFHRVLLALLAKAKVTQIAATPRSSPFLQRSSCPAGRHRDCWTAARHLPGANPGRGMLSNKTTASPGRQGTATDRPRGSRHSPPPVPGWPAVVQGPRL